MAAIQLSFNLRTSTNVKTVHLLGSWDNYNGQLPLSKDTSKGGAWKGTFRFPSTTLKQGQRYWYYYVLDGYHVSHDPAKPYTTEQTTGRNLNIVDIPAGKSAAATTTSKRSSKTNSVDIPKGRALSPSRIQHPRPVKPNATRKITGYPTSGQTVEELTSRFASSALSDSDDSYLSSSPASSLTSGSSRSSSSSVTSISDGSDAPECICNRWGITRKGDRVKLDCGGARCGYLDSDSCCSDDDYEYETSSPRRQVVHVRR
ncbi:MAG: hypothetical protein M1819_002350 [Sarea resinae]|nr:MAG: hypothetical protein M1819_002350 [Sarea resinae]